ncbi:MAG: ATP-binding protein, partial [Acidimicrobiia bacterium]|nr:ATP-binding protein [Acidimicrobiia bacterium]
AARAVATTARKEIDAALELAVQALEESRRAISDLLPPALEDLGLVPSLEELAARVTGDGSVQVAVRAGGDLNIPPPVALVLYRVTQEALVNAAKYAQAASIEITVDGGPEEVSLIIADDGIGFDLAQALQIRPGATYGLAGMRERVEIARGSFRITTSPGEGTRIDARIPR